MDLTLQVEFEVPDTLRTVCSRSQTIKSYNLKRHLLRTATSHTEFSSERSTVTPNPKLKSIFRTFGKYILFVNGELFSFWKTPVSRTGNSHGMVRRRLYTFREPALFVKPTAF